MLKSVLYFNKDYHNINLLNPRLSPIIFLKKCKGCIEEVMSELTLNSLEKDSMIKIIDDYKPSLESFRKW